ncbi:ribosome hibernation-promoting factor, HPF/YfiA family [Methylovirgula sp. HY1]|uniref:ribosome hibernation-promoting factor, HPF/YfiA family n=1 Tax=Methylovirgula sp. HY1 TaxID=2822761 RepID=UPI001C5BA278|nr:ribosome-associated translation inhibitor RaiA [Methylovirgula sp. HY1]QXX75770.1 Ribosome hibernation promotion factor [Methylovirgula sp. HY1]
MTLRVSGKHLDIGGSLRTYVGTRLDGVVAKYSAEPTSGHVTIEREGPGFRTDCILHLESGITLQVEAEALDAYASFNKAADRIENRLRRLKRRSRDRATGPADARRDAIEQPSIENDATASEIAGERNPLVIAESFATLKEMSVSGAVKELDIANVPVVIFRHASDGRTNIVYRRADGNIGWIDTASSSESSVP